MTWGEWAWNMVSGLAIFYWARAGLISLFKHLEHRARLKAMDEHAAVMFDFSMRRLADQGAELLEKEREE